MESNRADKVVLYCQNFLEESIFEFSWRGHKLQIMAGLEIKFSRRMIETYANYKLKGHEMKGHQMKRRLMKIKRTLIKSPFSVPRYCHLSLLIEETTAGIHILVVWMLT